MKKFDVIVIDPPYSFSDQLTMSAVKRGAQSNYQTMSMEEIRNLPIKDIAAEDGTLLALWVPSSLLVDGMEIMSAYGFKCKQTYIWIKSKKEPLESLTNMVKSIQEKPLELNWKSVKKVFSDVINEVDMNNVLSFGMGRLFRQTHEICLIGINNNGIYQKLQNKSQRSVCIDENKGHSIKPEHLQNSLELMFPNQNYVEIFARRKRNNWTCLGNEIDGKDIREALKELIDEKC